MENRGVSGETGCSFYLHSSIALPSVRSTRDPELLGVLSVNLEG